MGPHPEHGLGARRSGAVERRPRRRRRRPLRSTRRRRPALPSRSSSAPSRRRPSSTHLQGDVPPAGPADGQRQRAVAGLAGPGQDRHRRSAPPAAPSNSRDGDRHLGEHRRVATGESAGRSSTSASSVSTCSSRSAAGSALKRDSTDGVDAALPHPGGEDLELTERAGHLGQLDRQPGADLECADLLLREHRQHDLRRRLGRRQVGGEVHQRRRRRRVLDQDQHPVGGDHAGRPPARPRRSRGRGPCPGRPGAAAARS